MRNAEPPALTESVVRQLDGSNMRQLLEGFPEQIGDAVKIGKSVKLSLDGSRISQIVVSGLGGSAIGGDLLRTYLAKELAIPILVNRHYFLPRFVSRDSLVVISSYSGNTEETITAHRNAMNRGAQLLCITSNGKIQRIAIEHGHDLISIPKGLPPRAAVGYSFFPILMSLIRLRLVRGKANDIRETLSVLRRKRPQYRSLNPSSNEALRIALLLKGRLPVIYSATEYLDSVNLRWRTQLAENAKVLAFGNVVPEMNHNELVGWNVLKGLMKQMAVVFLRDMGEHRRVRARIGLTKEIVGRYTQHVAEVKSGGRSRLARMFSLVYLGDWVSYYLALLNGEDPTPVRVIEDLKAKLAKV
jgi:glucose/mannose-6-phosphate isomerase